MPNRQASRERTSQGAVPKTNEAAMPAEHKPNPPAYIPRRYWIAILTPLLLGGIVIAAMRIRSSDAYLRERCIGSWKGYGTISTLRRDGSCNVTWFGTLSGEGVWRVEDGHLYVKLTHGGNTFTDVLASPERWMMGRDMMNSKIPSSFIDDDHMKMPDGIWERVKTAAQ